MFAEKQIKPCTFFILNLADNCELSWSSFWVFIKFLILNWFKHNSIPDSSKLIIINACCVTNDKISRLNEVLKDREKLFWNNKIVLFWCFENGKYLENENLITISSKDFKKSALKFEYSIWFEDLDKSTNECLWFALEGVLWSWYWFVQISQWCVNNCSFCNIKKVKWFVKSKIIDDILDEIKININNWYNEIMLLSDDCWSYWIDYWSSLVELLDAISIRFKDIKVKLYNIYPSLFIKYFKDLKRHVNEWRLNFINIPIQSWSERILNLMNRKYNLKLIKECIQELKWTSPEVNIYSLFIINFPSEKLDDLKDTMKFSKLFDWVQFVSYSDNEWTDSYLLAEKIPHDIAIVRSKLVCRYLRTQVLIDGVWIN